VRVGSYDDNEFFRSDNFLFVNPARFFFAIKPFFDLEGSFTTELMTIGPVRALILDNTNIYEELILVIRKG
jgi:hypothetical protein